MPFQSSVARFGLGSTVTARVVIQSLSLTNNAESNDTFVVKYDTTGAIQWAARISSNGTELPNNIATDSSGNVYVIGYYDTTTTFFNASGSSFGTLTNAGNNDAFIVKYNSSGNVQWTARIAGANPQSGRGIGVDNVGNVYVSGYYANNDGSTVTTVFNFNNTPFGNLTCIPGGAAVFVVKYNTTGTVQWATKMQGSDFRFVPDSFTINSSADTSGNMYICTGWSNSSSGDIFTAFNASGVATIYGLVASGTRVIHVTKYNTNGTPLWTAAITGGLQYSTYISSDESGNVYVTGYYSGTTLTVFNSSGVSFGTLSRVGSDDAFIVKYNTSGTVQWITRITGAGFEYGNGISADNSGNVYAVGTYTTNPVTIFNAGGTTAFGTTLANSGSAGTDEIYIVKFNTSGTVQWVTRISGSSSETAYSTCDTSGNVYVTGFFYSTTIRIFSVGNVSFGTLTHTDSTVSTNDAFTIKYNTNGVAQWAARITGSSFERGMACAADSNGNICVTGWYRSNPAIFYSQGF